MKIFEIFKIHHVFFYKFTKDGKQGNGVYVSTTWFYKRPHPILIIRSLTEYVKADENSLIITNIIKL